MHHARFHITALAVLGLGFVLYVSTGYDDSYIAFWPAHTLATSGELLNYNGERVEQSSSLLFSVLLALITRTTGISLPILGYWFGVAMAALTLVRVPALGRELGREPSVPLALLVASAPPFVYWTFGSLETTLAAYLGIEIAIAGARMSNGHLSARSPAPVLATLAFIACRPESALILIAALLGLLGLHSLGPRLLKQSHVPVRLRPVIEWLVLASVCFAALTLFRLSYYGDYFPQPISAKIGGDTLQQLFWGASYFAEPILRPFGIAIVGAVLLLPVVFWQEIHRERREAVIWVVAFASANVAFIGTAGGDWMDGGRFFAHFAVVLLVVTEVGLRSVLTPMKMRTVLVTAITLNFFGLFWMAASRSTGCPAWTQVTTTQGGQLAAESHVYSWAERANRVHVRDMLTIERLVPVIQRLLKESEHVTVMSGQVGMVMYYLTEHFYGRIEVIDQHALTTRHFMPLKHEIGLDTSRIGIDLPTERFFEESRRREEPYWHPDVYFDLSDSNRRKAEQEGYTTIHRQTGALICTAGQSGSVLREWLLPGRLLSVRSAVNNSQFTAVAPKWRHLFDGRR